MADDNVKPLAGLVRLNLPPGMPVLYARRMTQRDVDEYKAWRRANPYASGRQARAFVAFRAVVGPDGARLFDSLAQVLSLPAETVDAIGAAVMKQTN